VLELPTQQTRRPAFHQLNQPVNAELRIDINKQMHVIFHNLDFKDDRLTLCRNIAKYLFQSLISALFEHSTPVLRAPYHMVLTIKGDVVISPHSCYIANICITFKR
jgi:hypothetical protein